MVVSVPEERRAMSGRPEAPIPAATDWFQYSFCDKNIHSNNAFYHR
jgi:hypothetical protein